MPSDNEDKEFDASSFKPFLRRYWRVGLILVILLLAFYLRVYHVDYPVIGYHNWKEIHYLSEARNFAGEGFFKYGFFIPYVNYLDVNGNQDGAHSDSFPTLPIIVGALFKVFGINLFLARFVTILFSISAVLFMYLFVKELSNREDLGFLSSFLLAINPLQTFFGRNFQLDNVALFFILASFYVYIKWIKSDKNKFLVMAALFFSLAILTRYSFFIAVFPMLFIFPFGRLKQIKQKAKSYSISILLLLLIPLWVYYSDVYIARTLGQSGAISSRIFNFSSFFSPELWNNFKQYIPDNYTSIGFIFASIGLILLFLSYRKGRLSKFTLGYVVGLPIWLFFMVAKIKGHSYHHYPLLPLFVILLGLSFLILSNLIAKFALSFTNKKSGVKYLTYLFLIGFLLLIWFPSMESRNRQFDTQFVGLNIAGDYIKENSDIDDKMFHSTHQSHGVLWHADRQGYSLPNNIENLEKGEELGAKWLFIYQWGFSIRENTELWNRIKDSYSLKQIAFSRNGDQYVPLYYLLEKGGKFEEDKLDSMLQNAQVNTKGYELTKGPVDIFYVNF